MFCRKCGAQMKDNAKWCPYCGQKVELDDGTSTQPNEAAITKEVQPNPQAHQPILGQQQYYQHIPMYQGMQNTIAKTSLTKRGIWGIIGTLLFLLSIISEVLILTFEYMEGESFERAFKYALQKPYIIMMCVAVVALLLILFSCSKTVLLAAFYYFYYYVDLIVQYTKILDYSEKSMLIKLIITASLALLGLTFMIINVFLDKRKQLI